MKRFVSILLAWSVGIGITRAATRDQQWKKVEEEINKDLPKSAISTLTAIDAAARSEKAWAEAIRATAQRILLQGRIDEGRSPTAAIEMMQKTMIDAPAEMKPVLGVIQSLWLWSYFQQNEWRFRQRSPDAGPVGDDIKTWDLRRILSEVDAGFVNALGLADALRAIPVADYDKLYDKGNLDDALRPTLYDLVAHEVLRYYAADQLATVQAEDAFSFTVDSPAFGTIEEFLAWKPQSTDETSNKRKAIALYQELLRFHAERPIARMHVNLERLDWAKAAVEGGETSAVMEKRLRECVEQSAGQDQQALVRYKLGSLLAEQKRMKEALELARLGAETGKSKIYQSHCEQLIDQILAPAVSLNTESVWNAAKPDFKVNYRNVTKLWFRLYAVDWQQREAYLDQEGFQRLLAAKPAREWSVDLPATDDYLERTQMLDGVWDLPKGSYRLVASAKQNFPTEKNALLQSHVWISDLSLVQSSGPDPVRGIVLNAISGKPIKDATVERWEQKDEGIVKIDESKTNADGIFEKSVAPNRRVLFRVVHGSDSMVGNEMWLNQPGRERSQEVVNLFTDRAIYRPGQTVRFKGIATFYDRAKNDYHTIADKDFTVEFRDANNKEISKISLKSNRFGSFQGSFTSPTDRVLGVASIRCGRNSTMVRIEEYKRPKFTVEVGAAKAPPRLHENVTVTAKAIAYTGAPIDGAKVKWSVTRRAQWPEWSRWCWWFNPSLSGQKQIAHGTAVTNTKGEVEVTFLAQPDLSVDPKQEPVFVYEVSVDVTDSTGEARSDSRSVRAGYVDVSAKMSADAWLDTAVPVKIAVSTSSIDGEPQACKGTIAVHRLKQPEKVVRKKLGDDSIPRGFSHRGVLPPVVPSDEKDPSDPNSWELDELVQKIEFSTNEKGVTESECKLAAGEYRAVLETTDRAGKKVTALLPLRVLDPKAQRFPVKVAHHFGVKSWSVEPGDEFVALWGTGYDEGRFYYEIEHRGTILRKGWSDGSGTQEMLRLPIVEEYRGGLTLRTLYQRDNRTYFTHDTIEVPWSQKDLTLRFESMRNKIEPGAKETWKVAIEGAEKEAVEMLGLMYDASLDAFAPHHLATSLSSYFYRNSSSRYWSHDNRMLQLYDWSPGWYEQRGAEAMLHRKLPESLMQQEERLMAMADFGGGGSPRMMKGMAMAAPAMAEASADAFMATESNSVAAGNRSGEAAITRDSISSILNKPNEESKGVAEHTAPAVRKNLQETAFFEPQLLTDEKGVVTMSFTMPEALTKWRFMGFAHDATLRSGYLEGSTVTAKDLMMQPNAPRFLREGDEIEFTAKVSNQSDAAQTGKATLEFADAVTLESRNAALGLNQTEQEFSIPAGESKTISWRIKVPDGAGFLTYTTKASSGKLSDGEEGMIPVLSKRQLVTESITLPIRDAGSRDFAMKKLIESGKSDTLKHQSVSLQIVSQPAWYAVMALPYLMEYPHECAEQTFNRYYANHLARHIAQSDPKIRRVFEIWRNAPKTLDSPLLKNQDLKSLMIEETPWLRDANSETEARRNVGVLFDDNRLDGELARASKRLSEMQLGNGAWPWFPGGSGSPFITLYIVTGEARLKHLGVPVDTKMSVRALDWLDDHVRQMHQDIVAKNREEDHFSSFIAMYLYARSFYLQERPVAKKNKEAFEYYTKQAAKYWSNQKSLMTRCHTALALHRLGQKDAPAAIVSSLRENALNTDELGMHWRMNEGYYWQDAPIETQAMIIETFREVAADMKAVDDCQVWLLKQKQTQGWKTTKSTADAVYALLLGGDVKRLASDALVTAELGGTPVKPENVEAGTGYYEKKFMATEVKPTMGNVKLTKTDKGVSWGSLHWQYLEDVSKITPHEGNPLEIKKSLYLKRMTKAGEEIVPVNGPLAPGDEVVTRIEIRVDRDMEYIHLKSQRGSGLEPVNVLSSYKFQDGLGYYEMTKDTADHFFIEYLRRGTYVFQTSARVQLRGSYPSGIAEIQCMYAPEFNSHSASQIIEVK
ncbi:MAG: hypothetical protein RI957_1373 [Verrucomicrobiota bacterium]|jgi:uncharacterized protein YfaS (alpha-2-macroglobulin family)